MPGLSGLAMACLLSPVRPSRDILVSTARRRWLLSFFGGQICFGTACQGRRKRRARRRRRGRIEVVLEEADDDDDVPVTMDEDDDEVEVDDIA